MPPAAPAPCSRASDCVRSPGRGSRLPPVPAAPVMLDQGEPGRTNDPAFVTGDGFSIELVGGPYDFYTRSGYIEGGNIQVYES